MKQYAFPTPLRRFCLSVIVLSMVVALGLGGRDSRADDEIDPRELHPWAQFQPGAWKRVRVRSEKLDEQGDVTSTSTRETTTTLEAVTNKGVVLRIEVTVEVAGRRFDAKPQIVEHGFYGQDQGNPVSVESMDPVTISLNGRNYPCRQRRVMIGEGSSQRVRKMAITDEVAPYVLRQETIATPKNEDGTPRYETVVEVLAVDMPYRVLADMLSVAFVKTFHRNGVGETVTIEVHCDDVPGGVVAHSSKEVDLSGKVVRRTTLGLLDYGLGVAAEEARRNGEPLRRGSRRIFRRLDDR